MLISFLFVPQDVIQSLLTDHFQLLSTAFFFVVVVVSWTVII